MNCGQLDWLYRFLLRRKTDIGRQVVIDAIKLHCREGHNGRPCPDSENRYYQIAVGKNPTDATPALYLHSICALFVGLPVLFLPKTVIRRPASA